MTPNRGLKVEFVAVLLWFNCVDAHALEGVMSDRDQDLLRHTVESTSYQKEDVPQGDNKAEAPKSMPDSLPLTAVFSNSENAFMHLLDANRITGVEPYQGDMLLDKVDEEQVNQTREDEIARKTLSPKDYAKRMLRSGKRNMIRRAEKLWVTRVVPYEIDASRAAATPKILEAFKELEGLSCLRFRKRIPTDRNWIRIYRGEGCYSDIGRSFAANNPTSLSLGNMCLSKGLILHETMHALGFFHEQSRMDRDSFVNVFSENVRPGMESNFDKIEPYEANVQDTEYDFNSIMQYGTTAFTRNGGDTMRDKFDPNRPLGGQKLSTTDILELNKAYQCHSKSKVWSAWSEWGPCNNHETESCMHFRQRYCFAEDKSKCGKADEYGVENEEEACKDIECQKKIDGHWSVWGSWGACSKTCDEGSRERSRVCDNPMPENGGLPCKGSAKGTDVCRKERCFKEPDDTNFENGWGMWTQGQNDDFDWELRSGGTPTLRTGPSHDHTTGDGTYAYIEGSPPRMPNEVARLISKQFKIGYTEECFTFYYLMNGKNIGYLDLSVKTASNKMINLFRKNGHQGADWINAAVHIPDLKEPFSLVFEAQRGNGELSDIAIDDIYFDQHKCPPHEQGCQDHNPSCADWAAMGECETNKAWMKKHCCKACFDKGSCLDMNVKCRFWAERKQCTENKTWMWKNCCRACRRCQNQHPDCAAWSLKNECESNPKWMSENCPASCKVCNLQLEI